MGDMRDQQFDPMSDIRPLQANDLYQPMVDTGPINENLADEELGSFHTGGQEEDNNTGRIAGTLVAVLLLGTAGFFGYQAVANRPVPVVSASQLPQTTPPKQVAAVAPPAPVQQPMAQPAPVVQPQQAAPQQADNSIAPVAPVRARVARVTREREEVVQPAEQPQPAAPSNAIAASVSPMAPSLVQPDAPVDTSSQAAIANSQAAPEPAAPVQSAQTQPSNLQPQPAPGQSPTVQPSQNVAVEPVQVTPPSL